MKLKKTSTLIMAVVFAIMLVSGAGCSGNSSISASSGEGENGTLEYNSLAELDGKRIGILTGTIYDAITKKVLPGVEYQYFSTISDLGSALLTNKIDAFAEDENILKEIIRKNDGIGMIPEEISSVDTAIIFARDDHGKQLLDQFNAFYAKLKEDGLADELYEKWETNAPGTTMMDYDKLPAENGTITMATTGMTFPFDFVLDNKIVGYETELIALFCEEYGYGMRVMQMDFSGLIAAVQSGKADLGSCGIGITEERKQKVYFSERTAVIKGYFATRKTTQKNTSFLQGIADSFSRTFIKEDRWQMFVSGIVTTLLITVLSLIFGTLIGFLAYRSARRNFDGLFAKFCGFMIWLIRGMPTIVLLMILYYIVFGNTSLNGFYVAVISFTLTFACSMFSMLKAGERAVDKGQREAAFTLGFTEAETFSKIILPQAAVYFLPSYKAEIVSLIKATAVVGYIAVQDITKVGDIVRSRTYEAFFPLIMTAVMYFVMSSLLTAAVNRIDFVVDPQKRDKNRMLKGVKQHD